VKRTWRRPDDTVFEVEASIFALGSSRFVGDARVDACASYDLFQTEDLRNMKDCFSDDAEEGCKQMQEDINVIHNDLVRAPLEASK
jgi:hypothetical protein